MTRTLPGADIRGYYTQLGINIPGWASTEAAIRCFADPDRHERGDRDPSMSINLIHGAYHCHACGAKGGAYDAALQLGLTPRTAIELMIAHGITTARHSTSARQPTSPSRRTRVPCPAPSSVSRGPVAPRLTATDRDVAHYHQRLCRRTDIRRQLARTRGWTNAAIDDLQLGLDNGRITIPVRDEHDQLIALLRYQPGAGTAKMRAATGSRRALYPHPAALAPGPVLLVEGEPDRIAAHSAGLPAIAIPGVDAWQKEWAPLFTRYRVTLVFDCDAQGRAAAQRIASDLAEVSQVRVLDLDPTRSDGYDLNDFLLDGRRSKLVWQ